MRRILFQTSTLGLGVSLAILKVGSAEAQTCTTMPGTVDCPQGTYTGPGLAYTFSQDTTVAIAPGSAVSGFGASNTGGVAGVDINLDAPGVNFTRNINPTTPVIAFQSSLGVPPGTGGDIGIVVGDVDASFAGGIGIFAAGRDVSIVADSAHTHATTGTPYAILVNNSATGGNTISIDVGEASTAGSAAHAVFGFAGSGSSPGNVAIHSGVVTTAGVNAIAVLGLSGSGDVDVVSGTVSTTGDLGDGVQAITNTGAATVMSESVTTTGAGARGIVAQGGAGATINSGYVSVSGAVTLAPATPVLARRAIGITGTAATEEPTARDGDVLINSRLIEFSGPGSMAILASAYDGDITINTDYVVGNASSFLSDPAPAGTGLRYGPVAIATDSQTGNVTINSGTIINRSQNGAGIAINTTTGLVTINTDRIETFGDGAMGITTGGVHGNVVINSGEITTRGDAVQIDNLSGAYLGRELTFADAIEAISLSGSVSVTSREASVLGEGNQALTLIAATGATLNSRNATNGGEGMNAIGITTDSGLIDVNLTGQTSAVNGTGVSVVARGTTNVDVDMTGGSSIVARDGGLLVVTGAGSTVINNRGHIETTGGDLAAATGAAVDVKASAGSSVVINNHGTIIGGLAASGVVGAAISFSDGDIDETLNLFTGSRIVGSVDGQGGVDTLNLTATADRRIPSRGFPTLPGEFGDVVGFETINSNFGFWVQTGQAVVDTININGGGMLLTGAAGGATTVAQGASLQIGAGGTTGSLDGDITANGTLIFNRSDDYRFGGALGGAGVLIKRGAGLVTIGGVFSFSGITGIEQGSLKITQLASGGNFNLGAGGELDLTGGDQSVGGLSGTEGSSVNIDDGSLTIDQGQGKTSTFGGSLVGDGALTVAGGGELNLTGVNTYTGPTTVKNGTLRVNGSISSAVTVNDGSILGGAGTINGSILIRRNAVIAPGNSPGVLTVAGPLTLAAGSTYAVEVDPSQAIKNDRIDVTGLVTIESGALLAVAPQGAINLYQRVNEYTIINATGGLVGTFAARDVSSSMALLKPRLVYRPTALRLQLIRNDVRFNSLASTPNQFALASAAEATGEGQTAYNALIAQGDAGLRAGYDALSGEVYGSVGSFLVHEANGQRDALLSRAAHSGSNGYWIEWIGQQAKFAENSGRGSARAEASSTGVSAGGQIPLDNFSIGGSLTYARTDFDIAERHSDMTITSVRAGAFAAAQAGFVIARIGAEYGQSDMDGSRRIVFPGVTEGSLSSYSSSQMQVFGELAFDSDIGLLDFEPFVGFAAVDTGIDGFQESGPLGLKVKESSRYLTVASAGFRISGPDGWVMKPRLDVTLRHAAGDTAGVVTSAFAGGSNFDVLGADVDADTVGVAAGLDYAIAPGIDMSVSYSGVSGESTHQDIIGARFGMRF